MPAAPGLSAEPSAAARPAPGTGGWVQDKRFRVLLAVLCSLGVMLPTLPPGFGLDQAALGISMARVQWLPIIGLSAMVVIARNRVAQWLTPDLNLWLVALLVWMLLSSAWSPNAAATIRQAVSMVGVALLALAMVLASWNRTRLEDVLRPLMTVLLVMSVIVAVAMPTVGVHQESAYELAGSWRGIAYQKNGLGQLAAVALILWVHAWTVRRAGRFKALCGVLLSLLVLFKSRSSTSLLIGVVSSATILLTLRPPVSLGPQRFIVGFAAILVVVPLGLYLLMLTSDQDASIFQSFGEIFGKDATFSGRTLIWTQLMVEIREHPWLGTGFSSFWGPAGSLSDALMERLGHETPNGHNGYLDLLNEIGIIGIVLFAGFLIRHMVDLVRVGRLDSEQNALHLAIFLFMLLSNLSESGWFHPVTMGHVLAMYSSLTLSRMLFEQRLRRMAEGAPPPQHASPGRNLAV